MPDYSLPVPDHSTHRRMLGWHAVLFALGTVLPGAASADCWEILTREGEQLQTDALWQISNKTGSAETGSLMGRIDGEDVIVPLDEIEAVEMLPAEKRRFGWLAGHASKGRLLFRDGHSSSFETELRVNYRSGDKRKQIPAAGIQSIRRCDANTGSGKQVVPEAGAAPARAAVGSATAIDTRPMTVHLRNGDILKVSAIHGLVWKTAYGEFPVDANQIHNIKLPSGDEPGLLELRSGERLHGAPRPGNLNLDLTIGQSVVIDGSEITRIELPEE